MHEAKLIAISVNYFLATLSSELQNKTKEADLQISWSKRKAVYIFMWTNSSFKGMLLVFVLQVALQKWHETSYNINNTIKIESTVFMSAFSLTSPLLSVTYVCVCVDNMM